MREKKKCKGNFQYSEASLGHDELAIIVRALKANFGQNWDTDDKSAKFGTNVRKHV